MLLRNLAIPAMLCAVSPLSAQNAKPFDAAAAFGARPSITHLSLSPDGLNVAYVAPTKGQGSVVFTLSLAKGSTPRPALTASGKPDRITHCDWVSNQRLACQIYGVLRSPLASEPVHFSRLVAVDADGSKLQLLSTRENFHSRGVQLFGGGVIDWLPDEDGAVLIERTHLADDQLGSRLGTAKRGLAVDRIDTRNLAVRNIEEPRDEAVHYISDGRGKVRIMGTRSTYAGYIDRGIIHFSYRQQGSLDWHALGSYDESAHTGFFPVAIDHDLNVVYGFDKSAGRFAVCSIALDGSLRENVVYAHPDVDVDELVRIGRRKRVVGVSYATDARRVVYFDPSIEKLAASLSKALPGHPTLWIVDSSADENKLLVLAGGDEDPGVYYLFDRQARQLETFLVVRYELEGIKLATVKAVTYPASDGTSVPGYLTFPPGQEGAKGIPAIVLPHGGPSARDEWGFDWLAQFFAARGFAVLQPNFRGSSGYGDAWLQQNGFKSWRTAIGDVLDAGRWLVSQGIADPSKLGTVGWSYGGYAALQSAVTDPSVFKAVVAIAPVTDLRALKDEHRNWSDFRLVSDFVGDGPHVLEGSPAEHADKIKVPVLLFHGGLDRNVGIGQSKRMAARLESAGVRHELVTWEDLDHYLEDSAARAEMLRKSDAFLRQAMGLPERP
jgi:dipeptidyl aminopeptidase/acylaminoacyl peptidase